MQDEECLNSLKQNMCWLPFNRSVVSSLQVLFILSSFPSSFSRSAAQIISILFLLYLVLTGVFSRSILSLNLWILIVNESKGECDNYERVRVLWKHADAMRMMLWDEMQDMNKMQNKRQKPNHEGNIISHLRKRQELELRIWKVVSGALQHSTTTRGSRPENLFNIFSSHQVFFSFLPECCPNSAILVPKSITRSTSLLWAYGKHLNTWGEILPLTKNNCLLEINEEMKNLFHRLLFFLPEALWCCSLHSSSRENRKGREEVKLSCFFDKRVKPQTLRGWAI